MKRLLAILFLLFAVSAWAVIIPDDRKVDWLNNPPGVKGGIINRTTIYTNLTGIDTTGVNDCTAALTSVIAACPSNQVVQLPAGTLRITNSIPLKSWMTLRGAGQNSTVIYGRWNDPTYTVWMLKAVGTFPNANSNNIVSGNTKGSTSMTLASTTGLSVGGFALVDQENAYDFLTNGVIEGYDYLSRCDGTRLMKQQVEILSISGNDITFTPPLAWWYTNNAQIVPYTTIYRGIGIEDLTITNAMDSVGGSAGGRNIYWCAVMDSWVKNVSSRRTVQFHILFQHCFRCTVRDSDWAYSVQYISNRGYGMDCGYGSTACLIENNWSWHCLIGFTSEGAGAWNVWGYNYGAGTFSDDGLIRDCNLNHGGAPHMNLYEGNNMNAVGADNIHAGSGYNTVFRCNSRGWQPNASVTSTNNYQRAISFNKGNWSNNVVGCVLGDPTLSNLTFSNFWTYEATTNNSANARPYIWRLGFKSAGFGTADWSIDVYTNTLRHGNYDYASNTVAWDPTIADHAIPNSLYLSAQPSWWGYWGTPWPPIGSDLTPMVSRIPAQRRYEQNIGPTQFRAPRLSVSIDRR